MIDIPDTTASPEERFLIRKKKSAHIMSCMDQLNQEQKEIIVLRDIQGFSYDEISEILNCSIGTVKSRINRSRLRLREISFGTKLNLLRLKSIKETGNLVIRSRYKEGERNEL